MRLVADERMRVLERRFRESGALEDEVALLAERVRMEDHACEKWTCRWCERVVEKVDQPCDGILHSSQLSEIFWSQEMASHCTFCEGTRWRPRRWEKRLTVAAFAGHQASQQLCMNRWGLFDPKPLWWTNGSFLNWVQQLHEWRLADVVAALGMAWRALRELEEADSLRWEGSSYVRTNTGGVKNSLLEQAVVLPHIVRMALDAASDHVKCGCKQSRAEALMRALDLPLAFDPGPLHGPGEHPPGAETDAALWAYIEALAFSVPMLMVREPHRAAQFWLERLRSQIVSENELWESGKNALIAWALEGEVPRG